VSFILNIDTAVETSSVCISDNNASVGFKINPSQKESAAWIHTAIKELCNETGIALNQIDAVAVSSGPGSYTGLRVGMSTAKGLCYALKIPLITINTLKIMASAAIDEPQNLLCPMIDARRMEVFSAIFDKFLIEKVSSSNFILSDNTYDNLLKHEKILFFGNGSSKFQQIIQHPNAYFKQIEVSALQMINLSYSYFSQGKFADIAYAEPFYGKEFYSPPPKNLL
jgi:tRNA threonylcarbamoyladenosine biosynthesis protein TsaB